jgi:hypothetical protein
MSKKPAFVTVRVCWNVYSPERHGQIATDLASGKIALTSAAEWVSLWLAVSTSRIEWDYRVLVELGRVDVDADALVVAEIYIQQFVTFCSQKLLLGRVASTWVAKTGRLPDFIQRNVVRVFFRLGTKEMAKSGAQILDYTSAPLNIASVRCTLPGHGDIENVRVMVRAASLGRLRVAPFEDDKADEQRFARPSASDYELGSVFYCVLHLLCFYVESILREHASETAWMLSLPLPLSELRAYIFDQINAKRILLEQLHAQRRCLDAAMTLSGMLRASDTETVNAGCFLQGKPQTQITKCQQSINLRIRSISAALVYSSADKTTRVLSNYFVRTVMAFYDLQFPVHIVADLLELVNHTSLALYANRTRAIDSIYHSCRRVEAQRQLSAVQPSKRRRTD